MIPYEVASFPKGFWVALERSHSTDSQTIGINYEVGLLKKVCLIACSSAKMDEECPVCGWWLQPIGQRAKEGRSK